MEYWTEFQYKCDLKYAYTKLVLKFVKIVKTVIKEGFTNERRFIQFNLKPWSITLIRQKDVQWSKLCWLDLKRFCFMLKVSYQFLCGHYSKIHIWELVRTVLLV